jgi:hypothetical protein
MNFGGVVMFGSLASVFADAALPQKMVMASLLLSLPAALVSAAGAWRRRAPRSIFASQLGIVGPALGLVAGAGNALHMTQTIARLPQAATSKDLAPAIAEIAVLVMMGAAVGLIAAGLNGILEENARR